MKYVVLLVLAAGVGWFLTTHGVPYPVVYVVRSLIRHVGYGLVWR